MSGDLARSLVDAAAEALAREGEYYAESIGLGPFEVSWQRLSEGEREEFRASARFAVAAVLETLAEDLRKFERDCGYWRSDGTFVTWYWAPGTAPAGWVPGPARSRRRVPAPAGPVHAPGPVRGRVPGPAVGDRSDRIPGVWRQNRRRSWHTSSRDGWLSRSQSVRIGGYRLVVGAAP